MRFALTQDQVALRDAVRDLLAEASSETARGKGAARPGASDERTEPSPDGLLWRELAAMGLFSALVPEPAGGLGLSDVDVVPILMEVGYAAVPHPVAETILAAPLLVGDARLPDVLAGRLRIAVAGRDGLVPFGGELALVVDDDVRIVTPTAPTEQPSVDPFRRLLRADLPAGGVLAADPAAVRRRLDLGTAAQLVGLGRRMLDLTTAYVGTRHQFGVPVGSFQAVKHRLADALLELEFAAPAVLAAGWALASRTHEARAVSMATILATEAASRVARAAIQCHGAIGYTVEYDLHRFAKRVWALAAAINIDEHLDRLAEELSL